ncbi:MAG: Bacterial cell division membrane protein [Candidatus Woesebacteria bacterium GW2011_GWB1_43_14]|uniref:Probable peptidoglycan glycosyltransferase FtsW n=1 Tax=Candidatus Woesebacteria bacterium GW2011_GWB1_43_14 TaxID=1618578 RepID=A0A0G1DH22_9BACT|nr:MAG: Bacterial cell division membrane protein [Candidatus Woesebacteria bacterium GW2011_GWA1_39_11b]KKS78439.1 MAG: Bacterial cell division membrane protein [Candidatus Woesebacteria bacterium GW2011_GWC1_42_9]KKS97145.1 MAG: Bacterial cell division membrane protein [Candidatus Woesebacteria bacterium GW2011_GWB1_43_14]
MVGRNLKKNRSIDRGLLFLTLGLTVVGVVVVADVSSPQALEVFSDSFYFAKQQLMWAVAGIVLLLISSKVNYNIWRKLSLPLFAMSMVLLVLVLIPGFGAKTLGAQRWLILGPIRFQPSELAKLTLAIFFADNLTKNRPFYFYLGILAGVFGLIMLQPDLGTSLVLLSIGMSQLFISGISLTWLTGTIFLGGLVGTGLVLLSPYRKERLMTFLTSSSDPLDSSYHIRQILIAIGSGGLFGVGLGQSRQKHLFIPETATDSVFAVLAEEIGFIGSSLIIILLFVYIFKTVKVAKNAEDGFAKLLAGGISVWMGVQIILNLSSMLALTPLTGIPLPFFSYGGSSLVMILLSTGILLNISKHG